MYSLYIDTHYDLSLAVFKNESVLIEKKMQSNFISEDTIPLLEEMLKEINIKIDEIKQIVVISGPGSFTGVRIGIVIAKILAYTKNIPVKTLSYLEALALNYDKDVILGIKDRNGIFVGEFDSNHKLLSDYYYLKNAEVLTMTKNIILDDNVDLNKVIKYMKNKECINPHLLSPLYVKKIEVLND